ncbi:MAG TPA: amino acid adenylation domain-containing protein [Burkholderiaceae bacterium]|nr:amino acid adenylation domain-containing protein [Burkholderiaceae bacterium]
MTDTLELLERLRRLDVRLTLDGDRLVVSAPRGALTAALREELGQRRAEVKAFLAASESSAASGRSGPAAALVPVSRSGPCEVSHTQQRLWFIKQLDPSSWLYNIPAAVRLKGDLDESIVRRCLADLAARHESLRTRFVAVDGAPFCFVDPDAVVQMDVVDLTHLPQDEREAAAIEAVLAAARRPFDLSRSPLLVCRLVRLDVRDHMFVFVIDHIVADGISLAVLRAEFQHLYECHSSGRESRLPAAGVQYLDYAEWERKSFRSGALDAHRRFWRDELAGLPKLIGLPTDRPRPAVQSNAGSREVMQLPPEVVRSLKEFGRSEGGTLFMVMLSAFYVLLHRYAGETDLAVGSAIANRNRIEVESAVGFFANNIVLRGDLSGEPTVRELIARVRDMAVRAYAHQEMPFDLLVEELATNRALDHSPLFQVLFVLQSMKSGSFDLPGCTGTAVELPITAARFDIAVDVFDLDSDFRVYFEYRTDLFDAGTIRRMMGHYRRLLEAFVASPGIPVCRLRMLTDAESRMMLIDWNATKHEVPREQTIHGLFEAQVRQRPQAIALRFGSEAVSYHELNARADQLGSCLRTQGVEVGSLVGILMNRSIDMVVAILGILKAGAAYVPLDPAFPADRIGFMMFDAGLGIVVTETGQAGFFKPSGPQAIFMDAIRSSRPDRVIGSPTAEVRATDLAYVIYTSGSTGRPKGVMLEHRSVVNFLLSMHREPGLGATDRLLSVTTLSFDIAGLEIFGPLTAGGTVVLAPREAVLDGEKLARMIDDADATMLQATPATWRLLVDSGWAGRPGLKMLCGGEALSSSLARQLLPLGAELWNMYGPTETTIWSTLARITDVTEPIPIGRPIANTRLYVLEPSGLPAPVGVSGELFIGGAGVARGYLGRDELTAEKFVTMELTGAGPERLYRTGDLVRYRPDGRLEFVGRNDQQIKLRGYRIELGEIEAVLAGYPGVRQNVVLVREDAPGDQRLVGYVVIEGDVGFEEAGARRALRGRLPEYMVPNVFVSLPAMPLTPNGKIDRKALPSPAAQPAAPVPDADVVMTPVQRRVADVWKEVLRTDSVGLHVNFFDLGGHSLLLVKLRAVLQRELGVSLALVELFQSATVAAQAERIQASSQDDAVLRRAQARAAKQIGA